MPLQCIAPHAIAEGDLIAYSESTASHDVVQHIESCRFCAHKARSLEEIQKAFVYTLFRKNCPDLDLLLTYQARLLDKTETRVIKTHLQNCLHCQEEMKQIEAVSFSLPAKSSLLERLKENGRQIIQAVLSPPPQPITVMRGHKEKPLFYKADNYQIIIAKKPPIIAAAKTWQVEGQITQQDDPLAQLEGIVSLFQGDDLVYQDNLDEFGYFLMENISPGFYSLLTKLTTATQIMIPSIDVP